VTSSLPFTSPACSALCLQVLLPLIRTNVPHGLAPVQARLSPQLLNDWFGAVLKLKNDIGQWISKHSKHIPVMVTGLRCPRSP